MYPTVRYGITRVRPDDVRGLQCTGWPVDITGLLLLLPRKDAEAEEYREKVLQENWHLEEDLFCRQNSNTDFFYKDWFFWSSGEEECGHRSINLWEKSQEKIEELFYALAFRFAVSFFDIWVRWVLLVPPPSHSFPLFLLQQTLFLAAFFVLKPLLTIIWSWWYSWIRPSI